VPQWVRPLDQSTKGAAEWHIPQTKSYTTTTFCGKIIAGTVEVASDAKAEHEGRCKQCLAISVAPIPQRQTAPAKTAAAKSNAPKNATGKWQPKARKRR